MVSHGDRAGARRADAADEFGYRTDSSILTDQFIKDCLASARAAFIAKVICSALDDNPLPATSAVFLRDVSSAALLEALDVRGEAQCNAEACRLCDILAALLAMSDEEVPEVLAFTMVQTLEAGRAVVEAVPHICETDLAADWKPEAAFLEWAPRLVIAKEVRVSASRYHCRTLCPNDPQLRIIRIYKAECPSYTVRRIRDSGRKVFSCDS